MILGKKEFKKVGSVCLFLGSSWMMVDRVLLG